MSYDIKGRTVLITGANRGIGKAIVDSFINQEAAKVYAAVRNLGSAGHLVASYGDKVVPIQLDLTDSNSVAMASTQAADVEIVINNAGVLTMTTPLDDNAMDVLSFELDVNLYGLVRMVRAFAPKLKANGGGVFIQVNSVVSMKTFSNISTYSASKAAAYAITQSLREQLAEQGTQVISVHPGPIDTEMLINTGFEEMAEPPSLVADGIIEAIRKGSFHVFPDSTAKQIGSAYQGFAENVILAEMAEA